MTYTCQHCGWVVSGPASDLYDLLRDHWLEECTAHPVYGRKSDG